MLIKKHFYPSSVSILDRLAIVGSSGMGALEYKPEEPLVDLELTRDFREAAKMFRLMCFEENILSVAKKASLDLRSAKEIINEVKNAVKQLSKFIII